LVAGEEEAAVGMVDIRSRDNQRLGKMKVDDLVKFFLDQNPKPSRSHDKLYKKMWNPADFPAAAATPKQKPEGVADEAKPEEKKQE
jgi:hypothetical protein